MRLLNRVYIHEKQKMSSVVLKCIQKLQYTSGKKPRGKAARNDLSEILQPMLHFTEAFLRTLNKLPLTPMSGVNHVALRLSLEQQIPKIVAMDELVLFFGSWNIRVVSSSKSPSPQLAEDEEAQIQMAMQNSIVTAQAEATGQGQGANTHEGARARTEEDEG